MSSTFLERDVIDREPRGVNLVGVHTNFHAYTMIAYTVVMSGVGVCRYLAGGCDQQDQLIDGQNMS